MKILDYTQALPRENIAYDELLLNNLEQEPGGEILRFWESPKYFVVLGISNDPLKEVRLEFCQKNDIPIEKRASGGGTVLQGPGCLNYALILDLEKRPELKTIQSTHAFVLGRHAQTIAALTGRMVLHEGDSDLTIDGKKFSGNAMRRKKRYVLYHGTFLHHFDFQKIEECLLMPSRRPSYRGNRTHSDFLTNIPLGPEQIKRALVDTWK